MNQEKKKSSSPERLGDKNKPSPPFLNNFDDSIHALDIDRKEINKTLPRSSTEAVRPSKKRRKKTRKFRHNAPPSPLRCEARKSDSRIESKSTLNGIKPFRSNANPRAHTRSPSSSSVKSSDNDSSGPSWDADDWPHLKSKPPIATENKNDNQLQESLPVSTAAECPTRGTPECISYAEMAREKTPVKEQMVFLDPPPATFPVEAQMVFLKFPSFVDSNKQCSLATLYVGDYGWFNTVMKDPQIDHVYIHQQQCVSRCLFVHPRGCYIQCVLRDQEAPN